MSIETRTANITSEGDFIRIRIKPGAEVEKADAEEILSAYFNLCGNDSYPVLTDAGGLHYISPEAKKYFAGEVQKNPPIANAVVSGSTAVRLIANFFIQFFKPSFPLRLFRTEKEALEWLSQYAKR
jgi:hypothetical protein